MIAIGSFGIFMGIRDTLDKNSDSKRDEVEYDSSYNIASKNE
jgi:hypothetical protein